MVNRKEGAGGRVFWSGGVWNFASAGETESRLGHLTVQQTALPHSSSTTLLAAHTLSAMSLLRTLVPSLRLPAARQTCAAAVAFSSSARVGTSAPTPTQATDSAASLDEAWRAASGEGASVDDGPPVAPPESYPAAENPMRRAKKAGNPLREERPVYAVSVKATRNNTIMTFARPGGDPLVTLSGGKLGFKKSNRNGYEAGYQCAVGIIGALQREIERTDLDWELFLNGCGQGRDAILTALTTSVGEEVKPRLKRVTDRTPLKIGGTRGKKTRRV